MSAMASHRRGASLVQNRDYCLTEGSERLKIGLAGVLPVFGLTLGAAEME
jgi:hypothetical protein